MLSLKRLQDLRRFLLLALGVRIRGLMVRWPRQPNNGLVPENYSSVYRQQYLDAISQVEESQNLSFDHDVYDDSPYTRIGYFTRKSGSYGTRYGQGFCPLEDNRRD